MNPDQQIIYNTLTAVLEKLDSIETNMKENEILTDARGISLREIAELKGIDVTSLRRKPWLLPFDEPEYGKNPVIYSRRQFLAHERLIKDKGIEEIKRQWRLRKINEDRKRR